MKRCGSAASSITMQAVSNTGSGLKRYGPLAIETVGVGVGCVGVGVALAQTTETTATIAGSIERTLSGASGAVALCVGCVMALDRLVWTEGVTRGVMNSGKSLATLLGHSAPSASESSSRLTEGTDVQPST